jgi:hypothetical protein
MVVVFQAHLVTVELRDSLGNLILNSGALVVWQPGCAGPYVPFGDGVLDGTGSESMEVLAVPHKFHVTYLGAIRQQSDDDPLIIFRALDFS